MVMKKKGQEMSVSTLVLIVIGIVILVMLVLGFTMGWQNLWGKINVFQGGSVEDVISACKIAAAAEATYSYCNEFKPVTIDNNKIMVNCQYPDISSRLIDKRLNCETGDKDPARLYCIGLYDNAKEDASKKLNVDNTKVNSLTVTCAGIVPERATPLASAEK